MSEDIDIQVTQPLFACSNCGLYWGKFNPAEKTQEDLQFCPDCDEDDDCEQYTVIRIHGAEEKNNE